jgi:drug/metabolite transporter (DMT)-like permease
MELWIPISIAAAFFQNIRSALQKYLKDALSDTGATFVRFGFGFPLAIAYLAFLLYWLEEPLPQANERFSTFVLIGGTTQILGTFLLVRLFSLRNFAVGTAYSKTEPLQAAVFGFIILQETLSLQASLAIGLSTFGVCLLSIARSELSPAGLARGLVGRPALIGLGSGALFGISAVAYRTASLSLGHEGFLIPAAFTLACVTVYQTGVMTLYLVWREPGQLRRVAQNWRPSLWVGVVGVLGSIGWFTAMTIQSAAYVKALGQIELLFTFLVSTLYFREHVNRLEIAGICAIAFGIVYLMIIS